MLQASAVQRDSEAPQASVAQQVWEVPQAARLEVQHQVKVSRLCAPLLHNHILIPLLGSVSGETGGEGSASGGVGAGIGGE